MHRVPLTFAPLILFLLPSSLSVMARADDATPAPPPLTAPALYKRAVGHLNEGRWFEAAIADLTEAVRQDPTNSGYHTALGCAEVDRAGSLAYAAWTTDQLLNAQAQYVKDEAAWQSAQQDPKSDGYGRPEPVAPPSGVHFQIKDDLKYLRLTGRQAAARVIALGLAAQDEWRQGVRLAKMPQARAQAESVRGWGLQYERRMLEFTGYPEAKAPGAPKAMDVVAAFRAATKDDTGSAAYWEGLGDAYPGADRDDAGHADTISAWRHSLALAPGNVGLGFRLYRLQARTDPKAALQTLRAVADADPGNSLLQYGLAGLLFGQVHYNDVNDKDIPDSEKMAPEQFAQRRDQIAQDLAAKDDAASERIASEAVEAIEQGNTGDHYTVPEYAPPVPKLLRHAWDYWDNLERLGSGNFTFSAKLRELARAVGGYALVTAQRGDEDGAEQAATACIGMGERLAGGWLSRGGTPDDGSIAQVLLGVAVASIGYLELQKVYEHFGDTALAQETAAEHAALDQRQLVYSAALDRSIAQGEAEGTAYLWDHY